MDDQEDSRRDATIRQEAALRLRERRRAAHRAAAGLLLQQTIQADLVARGDLRPNQSVELIRLQDGAIVAHIVPTIPQVGAETTPALRTGYGQQLASGMRRLGVKPTFNHKAPL